MITQKGHVLAGIALTALVLVAGAFGTPTSAPDATRAAKEVLDSSYQVVLPRSDAASPPPVIRLMAVPSGLMAVVWVVVALLLLLWFARAFIMPRVLHEDEAETTVSATEDPGDDLPLPDHASLASARRFAEAIHVLLLGALLLTARRLRTSLADSLTSREALNRFVLPPDQRADLQLLLHQAEICHFGARVADAQTYNACLESYERLRREAS